MISNVPQSIVARLTRSAIDDDVKPTSAHDVLTTIIEDGNQLDILRDNMPFGEIGKGEFGTYFIGYAHSPRRAEQMLENMFVGRPPGNYDRLLDFSRAATGTLFFVPSATFLENVAPLEPAAPAANTLAAATPHGTSPDRGLSQRRTTMGRVKEVLEQTRSLRDGQAIQDR